MTVKIRTDEKLSDMWEMIDWAYGLENCAHANYTDPGKEINGQYILNLHYVVLSSTQII